MQVLLMILAYAVIAVIFAVVFVVSMLIYDHITHEYYLDGYVDGYEQRLNEESRNITPASLHRRAVYFEKNKGRVKESREDD